MTVPLSDRERLARELYRWWWGLEGIGGKVDFDDDADGNTKRTMRCEADHILSMLGVGKTYLTVFSWDGYSAQVCSSHKSLLLAEKAAKKCEKGGGARHDIWEVVEHKREDSHDSK